LIGQAGPGAALDSWQPGLLGHRRLSDLWAALNADPEMRSLAAKSGFELVNIGVDRMDTFMAERVRAYNEVGHRMGLAK
jgi:hypothetical protein